MGKSENITQECNELTAMKHEKLMKLARCQVSEEIPQVCESERNNKGGL